MPNKKKNKSEQEKDLEALVDLFIEGVRHTAEQEKKYQEQLKHVPEPLVSNYISVKLEHYNIEDDE